MPFAQTEFSRIDTAKRDEKHQKDKHRLNNLNRTKRHFVCRIQHGYCSINEISGYAHNDCNDERPIL